MDPIPTQAVEDYLKTIYKIQQEQGEAVATTILAERMGVSPASATNMVKRLAEAKLVKYIPYQGVALKESGREIALRVIRNHRLVELLLVEKLAVPWDQVHAQAETWEHSLSAVLAERLEITLGSPTIDPHGSPIPTAAGDIASTDQIRLADLEPGHSALVSEVSDNDPDLLRHLGDLAIYPGNTISVSKVMPIDGLITVSVNGLEHDIGPQVATRVFVTNPYRT
jgi:DtxR family Mn-dependent transcriptional regulator